MEEQLLQDEINQLSKRTEEAENKNVQLMQTMTRL